MGKDGAVHAIRIYDHYQLMCKYFLQKIFYSHTVNQLSKQHRTPSNSCGLEMPTTPALLE
jgi:hypothetical protein